MSADMLSNPCVMLPLAIGLLFILGLILAKVPYLEREGLQAILFAEQLKRR